eukprot:scaffold50431_cov20-Attheya_sp.AAC.1
MEFGIAKFCLQSPNVPGADTKFEPSSDKLMYEDEALVGLLQSWREWEGPASDLPAAFVSKPHGFDQLDVHLLIQSINLWVWWI